MLRSRSLCPSAASDSGAGCCCCWPRAAPKRDSPVPFAWKGVRPARHDRRSPPAAAPVPFAAGSARCRMRRCASSRLMLPDWSSSAEGRAGHGDSAHRRPSAEVQAAMSTGTGSNPKPTIEPLQPLAVVHASGRCSPAAGLADSALRLAPLTGPPRPPAARLLRMGVQASGAGESPPGKPPSPDVAAAAAAARPNREVPVAPPLPPTPPAASGCMCTGVREKRLALRAAKEGRRPDAGVLPPAAPAAGPSREPAKPRRRLPGSAAAGEGDALGASAGPGVRPAPVVSRLLARGRGKLRGDCAASGPCRSMASTSS